MQLGDALPTRSKGRSMANLKMLVANEDAQALVESAILVGAIAVVAIAALTLLGEGAKTIFSNIATTLSR